MDHCFIDTLRWTKLLPQDRIKAISMFIYMYIKLSQESVSKIKWSYDNIPTVNYPTLLANSNFDVIIYTDASTKGCLELMAVFLDLRHFAKMSKASMCKSAQITLQL